MADNHITAWIKIRDRARFSRDARAAARDIKRIGDAADNANNSTSAWGGALNELKDVFTGGQGLTGRTRIFGFAVGTVATALVGVIPLVVGLGGALVAVTGSLGAAAIGAGLLAGALTGVLGAGLGAVGLVLFDTLKNFSAVNTRFQTYRATVKAFGADSKQAATAMKRLIGIVATNGGPQILEAVQAWTDLRNEFEKQMSPVLEKLAAGMGIVFSAIRDLLPTVVQFTDVVITSLGGVLSNWLGFLTGREFKSSLLAIGDSFARISGPIGQGILNIFTGLLRLVVRMLPFLTPIADGFAGITASFADWAKTADLSPFLAQFQSWWDLLKATGGLLVTILTGGAGAGQSLVDSLTGVINGWNAFLKTAEGKGKMASFFKDSVDMTKAFAGVLAGITVGIFKFGRMMLPVYTAVMKGLISGWHQFTDALAPAKPFWDNILKPFLTGLIKGIGGTLLGAFKVIIGVIRIFASILGFLGDKLKFLKPIMETVGKILGFVFGGPILKVLGNLGKLSILLKPLALGFRLLGTPIRLVGGAFGWVLRQGGRLIGFFGTIAGRAFPLLKSQFDAIIGFIRGVGGRFYSAGRWLWTRMKEGIVQALGSGLGFAGDLAKSLANGVIHLLNSAIPNKIPVPGAPDINLPDNPIPMLARGGLVSGTGSWITGEAGPELNTLSNGRVLVQPLPAISTPSPSTASVDTTGGRRILVSKVYLRGRQIAEAVADEADDAQARG